MDVVAVITKRCAKCAETKPAEHFFRNRSAPTGLCSYCKRCSRLAKRRTTEAARRLSKRAALIAVGLSLCTKCGATKPRAEFYDNPHTRKPLSSCKECWLAAGRWRRERAGELEKRRVRLSSPDARAASRARDKAYRSNPENRQKLRVRKYTKKAIDKGLLVRQPCARCGEPNTHAHHHRGYDDAYRLDVEWLCVRCHMREHHSVDSGDNHHIFHGPPTSNDPEILAAAPRDVVMSQPSGSPFSP